MNAELNERPAGGSEEEKLRELVAANTELELSGSEQLIGHRRGHTSSCAGKFTRQIKSKGEMGKVPNLLQCTTPLY